MHFVQLKNLAKNFVGNFVKKKCNEIHIELITENICFLADMNMNMNTNTYKHAQSQRNNNNYNNDVE